MAVALRVGRMTTLPICSGVKKDGTACKFRGRFDGRCKFHVPKDCPDCPICYEVISPKDHIKTSCKHVFHRKCLEHWTCDHNSCPMYRTKIPQKPRMAVFNIPAFTFTEHGYTYRVPAGRGFELDVSYLWD